LADPDIRRWLGSLLRSISLQCASVVRPPRTEVLNVDMRPYFYNGFIHKSEMGLNRSHDEISWTSGSVRVFISDFTQMQFIYVYV